MLLNSDTLDIFVVHLPSRSGGAKESEPYRLFAAGQLKAAVDSIYYYRHHPQILIMGDFNDYPDNASVNKILSAEAPPQNGDSLQPQKLYHLLARKSSNSKALRQLQISGVNGDYWIISSCPALFFNRIRISVPPRIRLMYFILRSY